MFGHFKREGATSIVALGFFTLLLGVIYPLLMTGISQAVFPHQANGSLIALGGRNVGSELIGQSFTSPRYFWGRPSALATPYDAASSGGSNLGPTNPALLAAVARRVATLRQADPTLGAKVPVDLVTASASGLDPDITPAAAYFQVPRVARARGLPEEAVRALVAGAIEGRWLGVLGEARVNVVRLNLTLDARDARGR